jgi:hypothetical protein
MRINYVGELTGAASALLNRFGNLAYAFGIAGLQNYGLINNPYLSAYLSPGREGLGRHHLVQRRLAGRDRQRGLQRHPRGREQIINQTNGAVDMDAR